MQRLRDVLAHWRPRATAAGDALSRVTAAWARIVGGEIAAHCKPRRIDGNTLVVLTDSNAWSQQLAFLSERVISAVAAEAGMQVTAIRFRTGTIRTERFSQAARARPRRRPYAPREPATTPEAALKSFQSAVLQAHKAKTEDGWRRCATCEIPVAPPARQCAACTNARARERFEKTARLLFEAPWLGYAGIAALVDALTPREYDDVRRRVLSQWWDALVRLRAEHRPPTPRERSLASSFVVLKSGLDPERIAPAVVRDLLGDELHGVLYADRSEKKGNIVQ